MNLVFYKYQGTGNDFVIIDNREHIFPKKNIQFIRRLCDRRFGIGADGFMLLENSKTADFEMVYFNSDGNLGSMCGNGGRCIVAFAKFLGIFESETKFEAIGKLYRAKVSNYLVSLVMNDVNLVELHENHLFLNTGSPHHVTYVSNIDDLDVQETGEKIRYGSPYFEEGSNVNFVEQINGNTFKVRTYERGVENETLSCGTGVTAVAIASHFSKKTSDCKIILQTLGGDLEVSFDTNNNTYHNIVLKGAANFVFKGKVESGIIV